MSTPKSQNIYLAVAHHLSNPKVLSTEERLFQDAFRTVEKRRKSQGNLPAVFDNLNSARTINDVRFLLQHEQASNAIWKNPVGKKWLEVFGKYAETIWTYKSIVDSIANLGSGIGAPIWSTCAFVINVFKEIGAALECLENTGRTLESSVRRFGRYMQEGIELSSDLHDAMSTYFEVVIEFVVDVHSDLASSLTKSVFKAVQGTLRAKLKTFDTRIHHIIDDVDKSANIDTLRDMKSQFTALEGKVDSALVNPQPVSSTTLPTGLHMIYGLPPLNRNFTGQQQSLKVIWNLLNNGSHTGQKRTAIHGMGGIGKTQLLLKYAYDHIQAAARPQPYDTIIWVNATSSRSVFAAISSFMNINGFYDSLTNDGKTSYTAFYTRLKQSSKYWLMIFDNVNDQKHVLEAIPPGSDGHVLFSTRHPFVAGQLSSVTDNLEITPMDKATSMKLISRLTQSSEHPADRDAVVASDVADFAAGLPLLLEQIVHNAILGRRSLAATLENVRERTRLLEQQNRASLHEDDLSLGGLVMQTFETLDSQYPKAGALLKVLIYLEPSSIPVSLFHDCVGRMQEFLSREYTYTRGALDQVAGRQMDRKVNLDIPGSSQKGSRRYHFRSLSPFRRSGSSRDLRSSLPLDDIEPASSLSQVCGTGTPLGQLFENQIMLDSAFDILVHAAILRKLNDKELWLHDRVSEVAKALVAEDMITTQHMALAAATMVYIASPTPHSGSISPSHKAARYLPHLVACHTNLKDLGILNNCSIGPEISHLIASMLDGLGAASPGIFDHENPQSAQERADSRAEITNFYQQAYAGYMAGWLRLKTHHNIVDNKIAQHVRADREYEKSLSVYMLEHYMNDRQRLGRNAPWRTMQTACKLSKWLERDPATIEQALQYTRTAIKFHTEIFGLNDDDTINLKRELCYQFQRAERWREAYDVGINNLKDWLYSRPNGRQRNRKIDFKNMWKDYQSAVFALDLSTCCMELANSDSLTQTRKPSWASEAVTWTEIRLRHQHMVYGEDDYINEELTTRLAKGYEMTGDFRAAIYRYGQAAFCMLADMVPERELPDNGSQYRATLQGDEFLIEKAVKVFEEAMLRLVCVEDGKLGKFEDLDIDLKKSLRAVQSRVEIWRCYREKFGVGLSFEEERIKVWREFEENEERIRLQEEEMYGKIVALEEIDDLDEDKENPAVRRLGNSVVKGKDAEVFSEESCQVPVAELNVELRLRDV